MSCHSSLNKCDFKFIAPVIKYKIVFKRPEQFMKATNVTTQIKEYTNWTTNGWISNQLAHQPIETFFENVLKLRYLVIICYNLTCSGIYYFDGLAQNLQNSENLQHFPNILQYISEWNGFSTQEF